MKTSEIARRTGVKTETVLFYEKAGLLPRPKRTEGNYRQYQKSDEDRLLFIRSAREFGFDLDSIRKLLKLYDDKERSCGDFDEIARAQLQDIRRKIAALQKLETFLEDAVGSCKSGRIAECNTIQQLGVFRVMKNRDELE